MSSYLLTLRHWWQAKVQRRQDRTSHEQAAARHDLIRALNGEFEADVAEMRALLDVATGRRAQERDTHP